VPLLKRSALGGAGADTTLERTICCISTLSAAALLAAWGNKSWVVVVVMALRLGLEFSWPAGSSLELSGDAENLARFRHCQGLGAREPAQVPTLRPAGAYAGLGQSAERADFAARFVRRMSKPALLGCYREATSRADSAGRKSDLLCCLLESRRRRARAGLWPFPPRRRTGWRGRTRRRRSRQLPKTGWGLVQACSADF